MSTLDPIHIRLFAGLREQAGWSERQWNHPCAHANAEGDPITPRRLWQMLKLPGSVNTIRVAINHQFADADAVLHPGDELAFLPPISGG
jgi:molybdopterin synthase sulfur carrier subunit